MKSTGTLPVVLALAATASFAADTYTVDRDHTKIGFSVPHIVISTVDGRFKRFDGTIVLDAKDATRSSVEITIQADSVDTAVGARDSDLHSSELLDVARYPEIHFKSTRIERRGHQWVAVGEFTLKDVTKLIELPFVLQGPVTDSGGRSRIAVHTGTRINRHDYHVQYDTRLRDGSPIVGEEVTIDLTVEATKQ